MANNINMSITFDYNDESIKNMAKDIADAVAKSLDTATDGVANMSNSLIDAVEAFNTITTAATTLQQIGGWISATQIAMEGYNAALIATSAAASNGATVSTLLLSTLSPLQMAYGVLTGQITLAEAAQQLLNSTILKNPYVIAAMAIAALVAAVAVYSATHETAAEKITNSLDNIRQAHDDAIQSANNIEKEGLVEAEIAKLLARELMNLDQQIQSGTLNEYEAAKAKEKYGIAADKLNEIIPGITSSLYDETGAINVQTAALQNQIAAYYNLAVAKANAAAYEKKLEATSEALIDAKEKKAQAHYNVYETKQMYKSANTMYDGYAMDNAQALAKATDDEVAYYENEQKKYLQGLLNEQKKISDFSKQLTSTIKTDSSIQISAVAYANSANTASTRAALSQQRDAYTETFEALLEQLQYNRDTGEITEREYYETLESYRDEYLTNGSQEWQRYTKEIYNYEQQLLEEQKKQLEDKKNEAKNLYNEICDYALEKIGEVEKKQEEYSKKLSSYGSLFNKNTIEFDGETIEYYSLADIDKDIEAINAYSDKMLEFKNRSAEFGISDKAISSYLAEINNMSVDEGTMALNALLSADDDKLMEYMPAYDKLLTASDEAAGDYYASELEAATDDAYKNMVDKLEEAGYVVPEGWKEIGIKSAENYGQAFVAEMDNWLATVNADIDAAMQRVTALQAMSASERESSGQTIYADNRQTNTTVYVQSERQSAEALRAIDKYQTHTQPWR